MRPTTLLALLLAVAGSACAGPRFMERDGRALLAPPRRCGTGAGRSNPLVTEWPASEKANLEAQLRGGAVAVEYSGCSMRVLTQCRLPGGYAWQRTTLASDVVEIEDEDQLWAKLPLGAVSLEGELKRSGKLTITTQVAGQLRLEGASPAAVPAAGECARATHILGAIAVGAFELQGKGAGSASTEAGVAGYSAKASIDRKARLVRAAGDWDACRDATDGAPHANCRSPIQAFLWPIPGRAAEEGAPGTVKVDLVSANASRRWDVYYDDEVICSTPCSRWLDPARPILLRARDQGFGMPGEKIHLHDLELAAGAGAVQVQAHGVAHGELVTGITFTTFGGMAALTGIALTAAGCGGGTTASPGMCRGGTITLAAGAAVTAGAVALILDAMPRAEVLPGGAGGRGVSVAIGPGVIAGRF